MGEKLLTTEEAADRLSVSKWTLYSWARAGRGPDRVKAEGSVRYKPSAIDEYVERNTHG